MATSGAHSWGLTIGDVVDEAAERCGLDPASLSERHLISARRSLNLLFADLENEKIDVPMRIERITMMVGSGLRGAVLPAGTLDVLDVIASIGGVDYPLSRTNRGDYAALANKSGTADRPSEYWVSQQTPTDVGYLDGADGAFDATGVLGTQSFGGGTGTPASNPALRMPALFFWPRSSANVSLTIWRIRSIEDAQFLGEDLDIQRGWLDTACAGLASKLAIKYAPDRVSELKSQYKEALDRSLSSLPDRGAVIIGGRGFGRSRTYRI